MQTYKYEEEKGINGAAERNPVLVVLCMLICLIRLEM